MNLIQKQATDFYKSSSYGYRGTEYKPFVEEVRSILYDYRKVAHRIEFVDKVIDLLKKGYDEHLPVCKTPETCGKNQFFENALFFLQEEVEDLEQQLPSTEINRTQKRETSAALNSLISDLNTLKTGQQITYDDVMYEFKELRDFLYLDKKNFAQLLLGKVTEMTAGGMVSETVSKSLLEIIKQHYSALLTF